ncbi:MAG: DUF1565 domain-containing protein, partial [Candidatus Margulisbacteria bacterium]|nr:DUF1565 domain-containing protein [Candidatus Margulisiibacteriota bacterium]
MRHNKRPNKKWLLGAVIFITLLVFSLPSFAAIYYVKPAGSDSNTGLSEGQAWRTVYHASQNTTSGDIVRILSGTYNTSSGEYFPIYVPTGVTMVKYGGGTVSIEESVGNNSHTFCLYSNSRLEDLTIVNNDGGYYGVFFLYGANDVAVVNCSIEVNTSTSYGLYVYGNTNSLISGCTISGQGYYGINVYYYNTNITVESNTINGSFSEGGIYVNYNNTGINLNHNKIIGSGSYGINAYRSSFEIRFNEIRGFGYGIYSYYYSSGNAFNNTIIKCTSPIYHYYNYGNYLYVKNNILSRNPDAAGENDYGVFSYGLYSYQYTYRLTSSYNNTYGNYYSYGNVSSGTGDIHVNAAFRNTAADDYYLTASSVCRGAGEGGADLGCYPYVEPVTLISPNGGETWEAGSRHQIRWSSDGARTEINLYYTTGEAYQVIATGLSDTGSYNWLIPDSLTSSAKVSIEGVGVGGDVATRESATTFSIVSVYDYPSVEVYTPNAGSKAGGGLLFNITWRATDEGGIAEIQLYYTTGEGWQTIATGEQNDGIYSWTAPIIDTGEAIVAVLALDDSAAHNVGSAESAYFIIDSAPPSVPSLATPANGSTTTEGKPTFTWEAASDNLSGIVSYEVMVNGVSYVVGNVLSYTPGANLPDGTITWEVRAKDGAGNWGGWSSIFNFTHNDTDPPVVEVLVPDGGEIWNGLATHEVTWTATDESGISEIRINYTIGDGWTSIITNESNDGVYSWYLPGLNSAEALVSIEAFDNSPLRNLGTAQSADYFTIDSQPPSVPVLEGPASGEVLGFAPEISWFESTDNLSGVAAYELTFDGVVVATFDAFDLSTGTPFILGEHSWKVRAQDNAGNWSNYSETWTYTITSDVFVDAVNGSDGNTGTSEAQAWQTLTNAFDNVGAGQSVWVRAGLYDDVALGENFPLYIPDGVRVSSYNNEPVTIEVSAGY